MLYTTQGPYEPHTENVVKCFCGVNLAYQRIHGNMESGDHTRQDGRDIRIRRQWLRVRTYFLLTTMALSAGIAELNTPRISKIDVP